MPSSPCASQVIKYKGLFNYSGFLQGIRGWFSSNDYLWQEDLNKYRASSDGGEHEVKMVGERKINEYIKYKISVWIRAWNIKEVEVIQHGEKVKMTDARVYIEIDTSYDTDYQELFEKNAFLKGLRDFYEKKIIKRIIGDHWEDNLVLKLISLVGFIKGYLKLEETV